MFDMKIQLLFLRYIESQFRTGEGELLSKMVANKHMTTTHLAYHRNIISMVSHIDSDI